MLQTHFDGPVERSTEQLLCVSAKDKPGNPVAVSLGVGQLPIRCALHNLVCTEQNVVDGIPDKDHLLFAALTK
jgi:hypothetical protein